LEDLIDTETKKYSKKMNLSRNVRVEEKPEEEITFNFKENKDKLTKLKNEFDNNKIEIDNIKDQNDTTKKEIQTIKLEITTLENDFDREVKSISSDKIKYYITNIKKLGDNNTDLKKF